MLKDPYENEFIKNMATLKKATTGKESDLFGFDYFSKKSTSKLLSLFVLRNFLSTPFVIACVPKK